MKKTLTFVFALILILSLSIVAFAEEITVTEEQGATIIDTIMNSTVWVSVGLFIATAFGLIVFVHKKIGSISSLIGSILSLIKSKADTKTILDGVNSATSDTLTEIQSKFSEIETKLNQAQENEKTLIALLSMYIMNDTKYNSTAKAEIMKYITGIKQFTGSISEICDKASEAIAEAQKAEIKEETPTLDAIVSEAQSAKMSLE